MNLVGKIITILILLLSVCFMMIGIMVNASHQNWRKLAEDNKALIDQLNTNRGTILAQTSSKNVEIEKEKVARMLRIQQLESQLLLARDDYEKTIEQLAAQRIKAESAFRVVEESEERIAEQDTLIAQLQGQLQLLTEDVAKQRATVVAMTNQIFELNSTKQSLNKMKMDLAEQATEQGKVLTAYGLTPNSLTDEIPRDLTGLITAIDGDKVVVNLGLDDGLREGHAFDIFRDGRYVGTAKVIRAEANRSAAVLDKALTKVPVQVRDRVTTQWVLDDIRGR